VRFSSGMKAEKLATGLGHGPSLPKENCPAIHNPIVDVQMLCFSLVGSFGITVLFFSFFESLALIVTSSKERDNV